MTDSELVAVATFLNKIEAELAQSALEAADIESMVSADDAGGMRPHFWMSGVKLLVRSEDVTRAVEALSAVQQQADDTDAVDKG